MRRLTRRLLLGLAFVFAFLLIWQKLHIVVWIHAEFWQLLLLFVGLAIAIYLVFDRLLPD